jgi:hypothetical protein
MSSLKAVAPFLALNLVLQSTAAFNTGSNGIVLTRANHGSFTNRRQSFNLGSFKLSGSSSQSAQVPAIVADFSQILAQSAILASLSSMLLYNIPNLPMSTKSSPSANSISLHGSVREAASQFEQSFKIRCITDGFEFNDVGAPNIAHGESLSYRQCEALQESVLGLL